MVQYGIPDRIIVKFKDEVMNNTPGAKNHFINNIGEYCPYNTRIERRVWKQNCLIFYARQLKYEMLEYQIRYDSWDYTQTVRMSNVNRFIARLQDEGYKV